MNENMLSYAELLLQQGKYKESEKILKDLLSADPSNAYLLGLLAEANLQLQKFDVANELIHNAIGLEPDQSHYFYIKSRIAIQLDDFDTAEQSIREALVLTSDDADYYALWSTISLARKDFEKALELADHALSLEPENILALNTRSSALIKLNRSEQAFVTIEGALKEDPNNAYTHANYGWSLLEKGEHKKALVHFREALKNDPGFEYAQSGMAEAIKANNFVYRMFLKYSFWMGNLTSKYQWGVIIGFYIGFKVIRTIAANNEQLQPYLTPFVILLAVIALSTWLITPLSNLLLRLDKYGRYLLTKNELNSSNLVGSSLILSIVSLLAYFISGNDAFLSLVIFGIAMILPLGTIFLPCRPAYAIPLFVGILALVGIAAIVNTFLTNELVNGYTMFFLFGFMTFQWIANYLAIKDSNV